MWLSLFWSFAVAYNSQWSTFLAPCHLLPTTCTPPHLIAHGTIGSHRDPVRWHRLTLCLWCDLNPFLPFNLSQKCRIRGGVMAFTFRGVLVFYISLDDRRSFRQLLSLRPLLRGWKGLIGKEFFMIGRCYGYRKSSDRIRIVWPRERSAEGVRVSYSRVYFGMLDE